MASSGRIYIVKQATFNEFDFPFKTGFASSSVRDSSLDSAQFISEFSKPWLLPTVSAQISHQDSDSTLVNNPITAESSYTQPTTCRDVLVPYSSTQTLQFSSTDQTSPLTISNTDQLLSTDYISRSSTSPASHSTSPTSNDFPVVQNNDIPSSELPVPLPVTSKSGLSSHLALNTHPMVTRSKSGCGSQ